MPLCSKLELDGSRANGFAGRPWKSIQWELLAPLPVDNEYWLISKAINSSKDLILRIEPQSNSTLSNWNEVFPEGTYLVRQTLQNWANVSASEIFEFVRSTEADMLIAIIFARHEYQGYERSMSLQYQSLAVCCSCDDSIFYQNNSSDCFTRFPEVKSSYMWTITFTDGTAVEIANLELQDSALYIPPFTLFSGFGYVLKVKVVSQLCSQEQAVSQSEESVTIFVKQNAPLAVIQGGNRVLSKVSTSSAQYFALNASSSKNMDFSDNDVAQKALSFSWSCKFRANWSYIGWKACDPFLFRNRAPCNKSVCFLDLNSTEDGMTYVFTVRVAPLILLWMKPLTGNNPGICTYAFYLSLVSTGVNADDIAVQCAANDTLSVQVSVQIYLTSTTLPAIDVDIASPLLAENKTYMIDSEISLTVQKSNIDDSVTLQALFYPSQKISAIQWKLENFPGISCQNAKDWCNPFNLRSKQTALFPGVLEDTVKDACNSNPSSKCGSVLSFYPYVLKSLGTYNFSVTVVDSSGISGRASILLSVNHAPIGGQVQISPSSGIALTDWFAITSEGWFDPEQPDFFIDSYCFTYRESTCLTSDCEVIISSSQRNSIVTQLPAGDLSIFVYATDYLGATSQAVLQRVTVGMPSNLQLTIISSFKYVPQDPFQLLCLISSVGILLKSTANQQNDIRTNAINLIQSEILKDGWTQTFLNTSDFTKLVLQAASSINELLSFDLSSETKQLALKMLFECGNVVLGMFEKKQQNVFPYVPEAIALATVLSNATNYLFGSNEASERSMTNMRSIARIGRLPVEPYYIIKKVANLHFVSPDFDALYLQVQNLLDFVLIISYLGSSNLLFNSTTIHVNDVFYEITKRVTGFQMSGESVVIPADSIFECLAYENIATCCVQRPSEKCCVGSSCNGNMMLAGASSSAFVPVQNTVLDALQLYDIIFADIGNQFAHLTSETLLSSSVLIQIRPLSQIPLYFPSVVVRINMQLDVVQLLLSKSVTTESNQGYFAACQLWDFQKNAWSSAGIENYNGITLPQKVCQFNPQLNKTQCFYFVECLVTSLSAINPNIVSVLRQEVDCDQTPFGTQRYDACGVCGGTNSTCSGCDNIPYEKVFGEILTKGCSGHGTCSGGPTCHCCADGVGLMQGETCPWFGIMCNLFCSSDAVADSSLYAASKSWIQCNSHGQCGYDIVSGNVVCICNPGYVDENVSVNSKCDYLVPVLHPNDPAFLMFLKVGIPLMFAFLMFGVLACIFARRVRNQAVQGRKTVESVVMKLPKPTSEEIGAASQQSVVTLQRKLRPKQEASLKKKAAARLSQEAKLDRIEMDVSSLPKDPRNMLVPAASVSAFVTTSAFEVDSDVMSSDDFALKTTFQRLAKLRSSVQSNTQFSSADGPPTEEIFANEELVSAMVKAGSRHPVSLSYPEASRFSRLSKRTEEPVVQAELNARQREVNLQSQHGPSRLNLPHFVRERMKSGKYTKETDSEDEAFV